jgi:hypothetical protein
MLLFGCLLAFGAAAAPRIVLIFAWIFAPRWDLAFRDQLILPILGILFAPYTAIMYLLVWSPAGLAGFDWVWLALGVLLDIMKWSQIARNREGIPGVKSSRSVTAVDRSITEPTAEERQKWAELDALDRQRDEGQITEAEYQARKREINK